MQSKTSLLPSPHRFSSSILYTFLLKVLGTRGWESSFSAITSFLCPWSLMEYSRKRAEDMLSLPRGGFLTEGLTTQVCLCPLPRSGNPLSLCCKSPPSDDFSLIHACVRNISKCECSFLPPQQKNSPPGRREFHEW